MAIAHPPETLEGWYALHDTYRAISPEARARATAGLPRLIATLNERARGTGWSCLVLLTGGPADVLTIHFREKFDALAEPRDEIERAAGEGLRREWSLLSVTEAGLYHVSAELAREATARGGKVGDEAYAAALASKVAAARNDEHIRGRLAPPFPAGLDYVSFYPMSKRRAQGQNWYALDLDERSRLMQAHGITGRKYAGRVQQIITGAIGLADWEWGVTLFARDLLDVKKLVTDMRFDEVSAQYAEFGPFYVGKVVAGPNA